MMKNIIILLILTIGLVSCCKEENEIVNETGVIKGHIEAYALNGSLTDTISIYPSIDQEVFITNDNTLSQNIVKTDYLGNYRFDSLEQGVYTVYVYSFDPTSIDEKKAIIETVFVSSNGETTLDFNVLTQP